MKKGIGIALSGGSAKGLAHIGVLEVLQKNRIEIKAIAGTSIGALVGGMFALKPEVEFLKEKARFIIESKEFKNLNLQLFKEKKDGVFYRLIELLKANLIITGSLLKLSAIDEKSFKNIMKEIFGDARFSDTEIPFTAVAVDLVSGREVHIKDGFLWEAAMASAAIPGIFPPVRLGRMVLVDGGISANVPVKAAREMGADRVLGVVLSPGISPAEKFERAFDIVMRSEEISVNRIVHFLMDEADMNLLPDVEDIHWADFSQMDRCIEKGREVTERNIKKIKFLASFKYKFYKIFHKRLGDFT